MSVGLVLIMLVEVERVAVKPELRGSEPVARVDALVVVVMVVLGAAAVAVEEAACAGGAKGLLGTGMVMSTEEAFATLAFLAVTGVKEEGGEGL